VQAVAVAAFYSSLKQTTRTEQAVAAAEYFPGLAQQAHLVAVALAVVQA
jgi:hypothetical protein